jgi:hypothetical protein
LSKEDTLADVGWIIGFLRKALITDGIEEFTLTGGE